jgi:energy-coupling factor transport system ATP-binding protein
MIQIDNLTFSYQEKIALENVTISIEKGQWVSILGHNGSGKSTLTKLLIYLLAPKSGSILIDGIQVDAEHVEEIRQKIGIVFQNPDNQFVGVTVEDDIAFGLENLQVAHDEIKNRIIQYAKMVDMESYLKRAPVELSGGQKQRVAIASVLAMEPEIVIFDEATSMLDPYAREEIMEYMKILHKQGKTIIMITHDMTEALYSDRTIILKQGKVLATGETKTVLSDPELMKKSGLELLTSLDILYELKQKNIKSKEIEDVLWALNSLK